MLEKLKEEKQQLQREVRTRTVGYIAGGLGLVAGLAWNDAIRTLIDWLIPEVGNTIIAKLAYALLITLVIVVLLFYLERFLREEKKP